MILDWCSAYFLFAKNYHWWVHIPLYGLWLFFIPLFLRGLNDNEDAIILLIGCIIIGFLVLTAWAHIIFSILCFLVFLTPILGIIYLGGCFWEQFNKEKVKYE